MADFIKKKILIAVDEYEITKSAFSEFETYEVYADINYAYFYKHRKCSSQREIIKFYS